MPFFDWLELCGVHPKWFKGSVSSTVGDALFGFFGARHTHIFGPDIKLVCDPEDMLVGSFLEEALPLLSALMSGIGGNANFVYGGNTSATYVGPKVDICRAEAVSRTSPSMKAVIGDTDVIDKAVAKAVIALSTLMCLAAAGYDMAIHVLYEEDEKGNEEIIEALKVASYTVTGRLMALLKLMEEKSVWAEYAVRWSEDGVYLLGQIGLATPLLTICDASALAMFTEYQLEADIKAAKCIERSV